MQKAFALVTFCAAAGVSAQMPLPNYTSTFSVSTATRGFYFQAPTTMVITGLRVPNERNHPLQNVEVFKMSAPPPVYPATGSGVQVFHKTAVPSQDIIPCALLFQAGDWVGILGGCGDASVMHSSYGTANFPSNVLGMPVTLTRFLTQTNIASSGGNKPYSTEPAGAIARVEVYVAGQSAAINYGAGAGIGANPAPALTTTALPILGKTATLSLTQNYATNQGAIMVLGRRRASIPVFQGTLLVDPGFLLMLPMGPLVSGPNPLNLGIPADTGLASVPLDFQGFVLVLPDLAMTNGTEWVIGQ